MAILKQSFVMADLPKNESRDFAPIPEGEYVVKIVEANPERNRADTGDLLKMRFHVVEGAHAKRVLFSYINLSNPSKVAEDIGRAQLRDLGESCGIAALTDTDQLLGHTLVVYVKIGEFNGKANNEIKAYKPHGSVMPQVPQIPVASGAPATSGNSAGSKKAPWMK